MHLCQWASSPFCFSKTLHSSFVQPQFDYRLTLLISRRLVLASCTWHLLGKRCLFFLVLFVAQALFLFWKLVGNLAVAVSHRSTVLTHTTVTAHTEFGKGPKMRPSFQPWRKKEEVLSSAGRTKKGFRLVLASWDRHPIVHVRMNGRNPRCVLESWADSREAEKSTLLERS